METPAPSLSPRRLYTLAILCTALSAAALAMDMPVLQWAKAHALHGDLGRLVRLAETFGWGGTVTLIVLTAGILDSRGWRMAVPLAVSSLGAGQQADGLKLIVGRLRPSAATEITSIGDSFVGFLPTLQSALAGVKHYAFQSFPSAHAATAAGLAAGLAIFYPRGRWLFALFALLAMVQRVDAQAHWCSDVLAGAALGLLVTALVQRFQGRHVRSS